MSIQDQYTDTIRQTQETWAGTVQAMTENVSKVFAAAGAPITATDPNAAIDQFYDFWSKSLDTQREVAKQLVGATVAAADKFRSQADSFVATGHHEA